MNPSRRYFTLRLALLLPTVVGVTLLGFLLCQAMPGGPVEAFLHQYSAGEGGSLSSASVSEAQRETLRRYFRYDEPWPQRYVHWIGKILQGDWGDSYYFSEPVREVLARALPTTLWLAWFSFWVSLVGGAAVGVWQAAYENRSVERGISVILAMAAATPAFALAALALSVFSTGAPFSFLPLQGLALDGSWKEFLTHALLPVFALSAAPLAVTARLVKDALVAQKGKLYLLAARARGLPPRRVLWAHALRNALPPWIAHTGNWLASFFAGSVLVETLFGLQGMGRLAFDSLVRRDLPVALAVILLCGIAQVVANLAADVCLALADARMRHP